MLKVLYTATINNSDTQTSIGPAEYMFRLTDQEQIIYNDAVREGRDPNEESSLQDALDRAYDEIVELFVKNNNLKKDNENYSLYIFFI